MSFDWIVTFPLAPLVSPLNPNKFIVPTFWMMYKSYFMLFRAILKIKTTEILLSIRILFTILFAILSWITRASSWEKWSPLAYSFIKTIFGIWNNNLWPLLMTHLGCHSISSAGKSSMDDRYFSILLFSSFKLYPRWFPLISSFSELLGRDELFQVSILD